VTHLGVDTVQHQIASTLGGITPPFQELSLFTGLIVQKMAPNVFIASMAVGLAPLKHTRRIVVNWFCSKPEHVAGNRGAA